MNRVPPHWHAFLPYVPATLLCLVAITQVYLTRTSFLTPWKGGGFGMFSTNDSQRLVRVWTVGPDGVEQFTGVHELKDVDRVGEFPSFRRLRRLAQEVMALRRAEGEEISEVRVEVWSTQYAVGTMAPDPQLLREVSVRSGTIP
jgi:hypothetical protein